MKKNLLFAALCASGLFVASCTNNNPDRPDNPSKPSLELTLDVSSVTDDCAVVDIKASDESTAWYAGCIAHSSFKDDKTLTESDLKMFESKAEKEGRSLGEVILDAVNIGNNMISFEGLEPETEYYAYAYSLNAKGLPGTVFKKDFTTEKSLVLSISVSEIMSDNALLKVKASKASSTWYAGCILKSEYTDDASIVTSDMQEFEQLAIEQGKNVDEILEQVLHSGNADIKLSETNLISSN